MERSSDLNFVFPPPALSQVPVKIKTIRRSERNSLTKIFKLISVKENREKIIILKKGEEQWLFL